MYSGLSLTVPEVACHGVGSNQAFSSKDELAAAERLHDALLWCCKLEGVQLDITLTMTGPHDGLVDSLIVEPELAGWGGLQEFTLKGCRECKLSSEA